MPDASRAETAIRSADVLRSDSTMILSSASMAAVASSQMKSRCRM